MSRGGVATFIAVVDLEGVVRFGACGDSALVMNKGVGVGVVLGIMVVAILVL